jgi:predicted N-acetyltransferase YhbS
MTSSARLDELEIGVARPPDADAALRVLARGTAANPLAIAVLGGREDRLVRLLRRTTDRQGASLLAGRWDGRIVAVAAMTGPSTVSVSWRLGPVAVAEDLRGRGIGTRLLRVCRARIDAAGDGALLDTDSARSTGFFGRFGFVVVTRRVHRGVPIWSMARPPAPTVERTLP